MRNLTLGALIVFGGILAALPFRKSDPSYRDNADPMLATGPSADLSVSSELVPYDQLFAPPVGLQDNHPRSSPAGSPASLASAMRSPDRIRGIASDAVASPRRDLRLPLTYDDLAVPLVNPNFPDGRFNAMASYQAASGLPTDTSGQAAGSTAFEPMQVSAQPRQLANRPAAPWEMSSDLPESILQPTAPPAFSAVPPASPTSVALPERQPVQGRLASDSPPRSTTHPAEETASEPTRERHWIRQPE